MSVLDTCKEQLLDTPVNPSELTKIAREILDEDRRFAQRLQQKHGDMAGILSGHQWQAEVASNIADQLLSVLQSLEVQIPMTARTLWQLERVSPPSGEEDRDELRTFRSAVASAIAQIVTSPFVDRLNVEQQQEIEREIPHSYFKNQERTPEKTLGIVKVYVNHVFHRWLEALDAA
jgi:hypothetical protein